MPVKSLLAHTYPSPFSKLHANQETPAHLHMDNDLTVYLVKCILSQYIHKHILYNQFGIMCMLKTTPPIVLGFPSYARLYVNVVNLL